MLSLVPEGGDFWAAGGSVFDDIRRGFDATGRGFDATRREFGDTRRGLLLKRRAVGARSTLGCP